MRLTLLVWCSVAADAALLLRLPRPHGGVSGYCVNAGITRSDIVALASKPRLRGGKKPILSATEARRAAAAAKAEKWEEQKRRRAAGLEILKKFATLSRERQARRRDEATARNSAPTARQPSSPVQPAAPERPPPQRDDTSDEYDDSIAGTLARLAASSGQLAAAKLELSALRMRNSLLAIPESIAREAQDAVDGARKSVGMSDKDL